MNHGTAALAGALLAFSVGCGGSAGSTETCVAKLAVDVPGAELGVNQLSLGPEIAQSFKPLAATSITTVALELLRKGDAGGTITLTLEGDSGDSPDGDPIAEAELDVESISDALPTFYTFTFESAAELAAGETYWLRLSASYGASDDDLVLWSGNDGDAYSRGSAKFLNGVGAWSSDTIGATRDLLFKVQCTP